MRIVHRDAATPDTERVLATRVDVAETIPSRIRGLMFRRSFSPGQGLVFEFGRPATRFVHTLFVGFPIDVIWLVDDRVEQVRTLPAWRGISGSRADRLIELPAGTADAVESGDTVTVDRD